MSFLNREKKLIEKLEIFSTVEKDANLKNYNTFRLESFCDLLIFPNNVESVKKAINVLKEYKKEYIILGNGSNIIIKKKQLHKAIIILNKLNKIEISESVVKVEAGVMLSTLVKETVNNNLTGLEWAFGIPGTIGGSIYGNAGCYNNEISNFILDVTVLKDNEIVTLNKNNLYFSYRDSIFKKEKNMIILEVSLMLSYGDKEVSLREIKDKAEKRKESQPLEYPSAGSVFRNPGNNSAGALIDSTGLKGYSVGGAQISEKHANFIINKGNATGKDIIRLIKIIKKKVKEKYKIDLVLEPIIID